MSCPRIAIATCAVYDREKVDDELLRRELELCGCEAEEVVWDDEGVDWAGFDLCLVRSTWDYHEKHREFLAWTQQIEAATALRNPADLIAWNSDKTYLREMSEAGVRTVPTVWVERDAEIDLDGVLEAEGWEEVVIKPVVDLGARNLQRARVGESATALELVQRRARVEPEPDEVDLAEEALAQLHDPPLYARVDLVTGLDGEPCLIELELIEPNLYLTEHPPAAAALAEATLLRIDVDA